ncbi:galactose-1-phosphate uridyl transferase, partial [Rhizoclosmatium hyalinum]
LDKANEQGIEIWDEQRFVDAVGGLDAVASAPATKKAATPKKGKKAAEKEEEEDEEAGDDDMDTEEPGNEASGSGSSGDSLKGKNVVFTGTLNLLKRADAAKRATKAGATVLSSLTKACTLVVAGADAGAKLDKANEQGIEIWDEQRFVDAVGGLDSVAGGKASKKRGADDDDDEEEEGGLKRYDMVLDDSGFILPVFSVPREQDNKVPVHRLVVVMHGAKRKVHDNTALGKGAPRDALVIAPLFAAPDSEMDGANVLRWRGGAGFCDGGVAVNNPNITAFGACDALIKSYLLQHPSILELVLLGFSAGAQFFNRYAAVSHYLKSLDDSLSIQLVLGTASSWLYLDPRRIHPNIPMPIKPSTELSEHDFLIPHVAPHVPDYNRWKYGCESIPVSISTDSAAELRERLFSYTTTYILVVDDTKGIDGNLDTTPPCLLQCSSHRYSRSLVYLQYLRNVLHAPQHATQTITVDNCGHDAGKVYAFVMDDDTIHRRFNPLINKWVLCSPHRARRPWVGQNEKQTDQQLPEYDAKCALCPGNTRAGHTSPNPQFDPTFVFTNDFPALIPSADGLAPAATTTSTQQDSIESQLLISTPVSGTCKVLVFTPSHNRTLAHLSTDSITRVLETCIETIHEITRDHTDVSYVQLFENKGAVMGCSQPHAHAQCWATSYVPQEVSDELEALKAFRDRNVGKCLLCEYARVESAKAAERVVWEDDEFMVVVPYWAVWPFETMIVAKSHVSSLTDLSTAQTASLAAAIKNITTRYDNLFETSFPYSMGVHGAPVRGDKDSIEASHLHLHFYPPLLRSATVKKFLVGFEMLGESQRDLTAEMAAARLRGVSGDVHYSEKQQ